MRDKRKSRIPIIALTANIMHAEQEKCLDAGMNGFVAKPFTPEKLETVIEQILTSGAHEAALDSSE